MLHATGSYTLSLSPSAIALDPAGSATVAVSITRAGYLYGISLWLRNAPAGVTGVFTPARATANRAALALSVAASVPPGLYPLTVEGTTDLGSVTVPLTLTVTGGVPQADFALALGPTALSIAQGGNATSTVTITRTNMTDAVALALENAPSGVSGAFAPASTTGGTSTLTLSVGSSVAPGTYALTVSGSAAPGVRSVPLALTVTAVATPDYAIAVTPSLLSVAPGSGAPATVTITRTSFTGAITLGLANAPAGVTGVFSPAAPTGNTAALTVNVATAAAPGTYMLTVTGSATPGTRSTSLQLTVPAVPPPPPPPPPSGFRTYATSFPLTENPISEGGLWINGGDVGLDWSNVATTPGRAIGLESGPSYTDATALLAGPWGPNQRATATVFITSNQESCYQEVELRLRSTITPHVNQGYEVSFKTSRFYGAYVIIVRWNGPLGKFTYLARADGSKYGVRHGDVVTATVVGNTITAYRNGVVMLQATDNTYTSGSPGMGFNLKNASPGCPGRNDQYGFTSFAATDSIGP